MTDVLGAEKIRAGALKNIYKEVAWQVISCNIGKSSGNEMPWKRINWKYVTLKFPQLAEIKNKQTKDPKQTKQTTQNIKHPEKLNLASVKSSLTKFE